MIRNNVSYNGEKNYENKREILESTPFTRDLYPLIYDKLYAKNSNSYTIQPLIAKVKYTINLTKAKGGK